MLLLIFIEDWEESNWRWRCRNAIKCRQSTSNYQVFISWGMFGKKNLSFLAFRNCYKTCYWLYFLSFRFEFECSETIQHKQWKTFLFKENGSSVNFKFWVSVSRLSNKPAHLLLPFKCKCLVRSSVQNISSKCWLNLFSYTKVVCHDLNKSLLSVKITSSACDFKTKGF